MNEENRDDRLHLPSLSITGFRGIDSLTIERLGRVTLLAGKNSVGKTTVLDAVRLYAARGHLAVLSEILESHEEVAPLADASNGAKDAGPVWEAIFHGRDASEGACVKIGSLEEPDHLGIEALLPDEESPTWRSHNWDLPARFLQFEIKGIRLKEMGVFCPYALSSQRNRNRRLYQEYSWSSPTVFEEITCRSMGPGLLGISEIMEHWNVIALTDDENRVVNALQPVLGDRVKRIGIIGDGTHGGRVVAKLRDHPFPVPLKSFGDGAMRLFGVALALVNSRDGFLLIDEAENGIHHTVQHDYWRMVLKAAHDNNVQVIATTHSYDCVRGFAEAMTECDGIGGALVRLEREEGSLRAVEYSERNLKAVARQPAPVEVR